MNILDSFPETSLDPSAEALLLKRGKNTDLVLANMRQAVIYGRTCCGGKLGDDELVSICYDAMTKCAELYKSDRGLHFFAFCKPRIRGAITRTFNLLPAVRNAECVSLDSGSLPLVEDEDDTTGTPSTEFDHEIIHLRERWRDVGDLLASRFCDRERAIMYLVFSLNFTFEKAGQLFGISRAAAQAIASDVIEKLRLILK